MRFLAIPRASIAGSPGRRAEIGAALSSKGFVCVMDDPALTVFADRGLGCLKLPGAHGVVLGEFLVGDKRLEDLSPFGLKIVESGGQWLIEQGWGRYVAFVLTGPNRSLRAVRDPSGGLACYMLGNPHAPIFCSDIATALGAGLPRSEVDWTNVAHDLLYRRVRGRRTGLLNVDELLPGVALALGGATARSELAWDPWAFAAREQQMQSAERAAALLRQTIERCVGGLAAVYPRLTLELSGGLDSSIVAVALGDRADARAINCVSPGPEGDERDYARSAALAAHLQLEEHVLGTAGFDPEAATAPFLPRPGRPMVLQSAQAAVLDHFARHQSSAVFSGAGGDSLFCALNTAAPVVDRLWSEGLGPGLLRTIGDVAALHGCSVWTVARHALKSTRKAFDPSQGADATFLHAAILPIALDLHPWLAAAPNSASLARVRHLAAMTFIQGYTSGQERAPTLPTIAPLLAQPVIELCLRIPTWLWFTGGRDRAIARQAFAGRAPDVVINRRSKGAIDHFVIALFEVGREKIRSLLLDGLMAQNGVIDVGAVAAALARPEHLRARDAHRLLDLADAEVWARSWALSPSPARMGAAPTS